MSPFSKFEVNSQKLSVVSFDYIKHSYNTQTNRVRKQIAVVYLNLSHLLPKLTLSEKKEATKAVEEQPQLFL